MKRTCVKLLTAVLILAALCFPIACGHKAPPSSGDGKPPPRNSPGY